MTSGIVYPPLNNKGVMEQCQGVIDFNLTNDGQDHLCWWQENPTPVSSEWTEEVVWQVVWRSWSCLDRSYYFRSLLAIGRLLYSSELKVSYREWPLETYYWPLSRWWDVFKELLHSNRIQGHWLYLLLSQESGKNKKIECLFQRWLISFSQDHWEVIRRLKTGNWWQDFKTGFWTRWLKFISSFFIR